LAQRLVRTLCPVCKQPQLLGEEERQRYDLPVGVTHLYKACGCEACNFTGYRGRTGIYELLIVDEKVREAIHAGAGEFAIEHLIRAHTPSIRADGLQKVLNGETTLEEVMRVTRED